MIGKERRVKKVVKILLRSWLFSDVTHRCFVISKKNYESILYNNLEELTPHLHRGGNLKISNYFCLRTASKEIKYVLVGDILLAKAVYGVYKR